MMWKKRRLLGVLLAGLTLGLRAGAAPVSPYPQRPIKLLLGYPVGGGSDQLGRWFAARFEEVLGQSVVVVGKPGLSGGLAASELARAPADGYTLYLADSGILVAPALHQNVAYEPSALTPIGAVGSLAYAVVVHPSLAASNLHELIAEVKAHPGQYSYASPGVGTIGHLSAELFKKSAGLDMLHIPYKGGGPALVDLSAGHVPLGFLSLPAALNAARAGRLRILAVTSRKRSSIAPDVPAMSETLPHFHAVTSIFLLAPPGLPAALVSELNAALRKALGTETARAEFAAQGASLQLGSPTELTAQIQAELATWRAIVQASGARAD